MSDNRQALLRELEDSWALLSAEWPDYDGEFAEQLVRLAADQRPDPVFRAEGREAVRRAARRQAAGQREAVTIRRSAVRSARPSPRPGFSAGRRFTYLAGLFILLAALVLLIWQYQPEKLLVADDVVVTSSPAAAQAALPRLPRLGAGGAPASGLGGGNVTTDALVAPAPASAPVGETAMLRYYTIFSGTQFILAAPLPAEIDAAEVYSQAGGLELTVARAQALAVQMGFDGPLYTTPQPADANFSYPTAYLAFQDGARLTIDPYGSISYERIGLVEQPFAGFASAADVAVAEQFALARGLLSFPYEVAVTRWGEVGFYPVINGQRLNQLLGSARVIDGQVAFLYLQWQLDWQPIGVYPLLPPETAWAQLLAQINAPENEIPYEITPAGFAAGAPLGVTEPPAGIEPIQYWQRAYQPGEAATVYLYPSVLIALDGSAPIVETWPLALEADEATRYALAEQPFRLTRFTGNINAAGDGIVVSSFEILPPDADPFRFAEGSVARVEGQVLFTTLAGEVYLLPNAPADLADGATVYVYGWETDQVVGEIPLFNWESIEARVAFTEVPADAAPLPVEPVPAAPGLMAPVYAEVTISEVTLGYRYIYVYSDAPMADGVVLDGPPAGPPAYYIQPVWQFSGLTDTGDRVTFYVQAVATEYLE